MVRPHATRRWGEHGRLGQGAVVGTRPAPGSLHTADGAGFAMVAAGEHHTLALSDTGDLFAAGHGLDGAVCCAAACRQQQPVWAPVWGGTPVSVQFCVRVWEPHGIWIDVSGTGALGCGAPLRAVMLRRVALPVNAAVAAIAAGGTASFAVTGARAPRCAS